MTNHSWIRINGIENWISNNFIIPVIILPDIDELYICNICCLYKRIMIEKFGSEYYFCINTKSTDEYQDITCEEMQIKKLLE